MKNLLLFAAFLTAFSLGLSTGSQNAHGAELRPASVPLVVHDPYFSIWSPVDKLTDAETVHWTGKPHPLHMMVRIDGKAYRLMGAEPKDVPALPQKSVKVGPLTTTYVFANETSEITLKFLSPYLPDDLETLSRPTVYLTVEYQAKDAKKHNLEFYFDAGAELVVNTTNQLVVASPAETACEGMVKAISFGSVDQNILGKRGDDVRIDWGHFILSTVNTSTSQEEFEVQRDSNEVEVRKFNRALAALVDLSLRNREAAQKEFASTGSLKTKIDSKEKYRVDQTPVALVAVWKIDETEKLDTLPIVFSYDDILSVRYFGDDLPAYWRKFFGKSTENLLEDSWGWKSFNCPDFHKKVQKFEETFFKDLTAVGGEDYAKLCALAYRQAFGAQKIVADANGMPLMYSKENFSNGSMGTVDLMYPCSPMLLYYSPALQKATMQPIFAYAETPKWKFPFAPHDIGTYPHGTGQTYGGGERSEENQMPVEESANMIIQVAALAIAEQKADFAKLHWKTLTKWADYLLEKGFDPENQLCTDDFAGHLAHNVNLSAKAIVALGAYAQLAEKLGENDAAKKYRAAAENFVQRWIKEADDGDHFRLAFDKPGTWSMKYNIMWDELLDLKLFPKEVMQKEIAYYKTKMQKYGLPLDNRSLYSKADWMTWIATMTENRADFDLIVDPIVAYVNETPTRVPLSDWYFTDSAKQRGFQARSVVGGFFAPMLKNRTAWLQQADKAEKIDGEWAQITLPGEPLKTVTPDAQTEKITWKYTTDRPTNGWEKADFDDSSWKNGVGGFGVRDTPGAIVGTRWNSGDIWIRRAFDWDGDTPDKSQLALSMHHDEDVKVYLNGVLICERTGWSTSYETIPVPRAAGVLKKGKNTFAIHCRQTGGGQFIDAGLLFLEKKK